MKKINLYTQKIFSVLFVGLFWVPGGTAVAAQQQQHVVKVRVGNYKPVCWQENGKWVGMNIDFFRALEKSSGLKFTYVELPWSRGIYSLKNGSCSIMANLSKTSERQEFMHFIGPYAYEEMVLVVHKDDAGLLVDDLNDLAEQSRKRGLKIGILRDAWYGDAFNQKMKTDPGFADIFDITGGTIGLMLVHKRFLGIIVQRIDITYSIKNMPEYGELSLLDFTVNRDVLYFGVSKKVAPSILKKLQQAANNLLEDGTFKRIQDKWMRF